MRIQQFLPTWDPHLRTCICNDLHINCHDQEHLSSGCPHYPHWNCTWPGKIPESAQRHQDQTWLHNLPSLPLSRRPLPNAFVNYKNIFSPTTLMSAQYLFCKRKSQITVEWSCPRRRHRLTSSNQLWVQTSFQKPNSIDHQSLIH